MLFLEKIAHSFCWFFGKILFTLFFGFEVKNKTNLKNLKAPLIIAFNHNHWLDPIFIMASIKPNSKIAPIHFAMWHKHYEKILPFAAMAGAFPVKKGIGLEKSLKKGIKILGNQKVVGIAPEERRRTFGRKRKGRRGVAFLAKKTNAPILPIYIKGNLGLKISNLISCKTKVQMVIGEPFYLSCEKNKKQQDLIELSKLVMKKIYQLEDNV